MNKRKPQKKQLTSRPKSKLAARLLKMTDRLRLRRRKRQTAKPSRTQSDSGMFI